MSHKKSLKNYLKDYNIDISDENFIKWIYIRNIKTDYMVTRKGIILHITKNGIKCLSPSKDKDGYLRVVIYVNSKPIHCRVSRLVAFAFIHNDDPEHKTQVNHVNGKNKEDNSVDNLEWCTPKENINHAWLNKLAKPKYGNEHPNTIYTDDMIMNVCEKLVDNKLSMKEIANITNVSYTVVKQIRNHALHNNISKKYNFDHYNVSDKTVYTKDQLILAIALMNHGYKQKDISDITKIDITTLSNLKHNKHKHPNVSSNTYEEVYTKYINSNK